MAACSCGAGTRACRTHADACSGQCVTAANKSRDESQDGRHECPMSLSYPTAGHPNPLWGGPPGPRPTPSSAFLHVHTPDLIGEKRVRGTRADRGVRLTIKPEFAIPRKLSGIGHECLRHGGVRAWRPAAAWSCQPSSSYRRRAGQRRSLRSGSSTSSPAHKAFSAAQCSKRARARARSAKPALS